MKDKIQGSVGGGLTPCESTTRAHVAGKMSALLRWCRNHWCTLGMSQQCALTKVGRGDQGCSNESMARRSGEVVLVWGWVQQSTPKQVGGWNICPVSTGWGCCAFAAYRMSVLCSLKCISYALLFSLFFFPFRWHKKISHLLLIFLLSTSMRSVILVFQYMIWLYFCWQ